MTQKNIENQAKNYATETIVNTPYTIETVRQDIDGVVYVSFVVKDYKANILYTCPDKYRAVDLRSIGWAQGNFNIIVKVGAGRVVYYFKDATWSKG